MATVTVTFSYNTDEHKRLHRWVESLPKRGRSEAIRDALNSYLGQNGVSNRDILNAIEDLKRCGVAVSSRDEDKSPSDVPDDVLENLNGLGL